MRSAQVEGAPGSWVTFVARAANDSAAVEVDGTVRYADGTALSGSISTILTALSWFA